MSQSQRWSRSSQGSIDDWSLSNVMFMNVMLYGACNDSRFGVSVWYTYYALWWTVNVDFSICFMTR